MYRTSVRLVLVASGCALSSAPLLWFQARRIADALSPIALRFDGDGTLDAANQQLLVSVVRMLGAVLFAAGVGGVVWVAAWSASSRLPVVGRMPTPPPPPVWWEIAGVLLAVGALASNSIPWLDRGLGFDEIATIQSAVEAPRWWDVFSHAEVFNNHVPFSALSRVSRTMFDATEAAYRFPALLLGLSGVVAVWWLARSWLGPATAIGAALLVATTPMMVEYAVSARGYTGLLLCGVLSTLLFDRARQDPSVRILVGYVLTTATAIWFHLYGSFLLVAQIIALVWMAWRRSDATDQARYRSLLLAAAAAVATTALLYAPILPRLLLEIQRRGRGEFTPSLPWRVALELSGGFAVVVPLAIIGGWLVARRTPWQGAWLTGLFGLGILVPWAARPLDLYPRFFIFLLPAWALCTAYALVGLPLRRQRPVWVGGFLVLILAGALGWRARMSVPEEGFRDASRYISRVSGRNAVVLGAGVGGTLVGYYLRQPVANVETVDQLRSKAGGAREVFVSYRRGMNETRDHPVQLFLETAAESTRLGNVTVYLWRPN